MRALENTFQRHRVLKSRRLFPFRHESYTIEYYDDEKDDELFEADSPAPMTLSGTPIPLNLV